MALVLSRVQPTFVLPNSSKSHSYTLPRYQSILNDDQSLKWSTSFPSSGPNLCDIAHGCLLFPLSLSLSRSLSFSVPPLCVVRGPCQATLSQKRHCNVVPVTCKATSTCTVGTDRRVRVGIHPWIQSDNPHRQSTNLLALGSFPSPPFANTITSGHKDKQDNEQRMGEQDSLTGRSSMGKEGAFFYLVLVHISPSRVLSCP